MFVNARKRPMCSAPCVRRVRAVIERYITSSQCFASVAIPPRFHARNSFLENGSPIVEARGRSFVAVSTFVGSGCMLPMASPNEHPPLTLFHRVHSSGQRSEQAAVADEYKMRSNGRYPRRG